MHYSKHDNKRISCTWAGKQPDTPLSGLPTFYDAGLGEVPCRCFQGTAEYEKAGASYCKRGEIKLEKV